MKQPPVAVAFDVIETTFSLESLRPKFEAAGIAGGSLERWFAQLLRDAFALSATGVYKPFGEIAASTLETAGADASQAQAILQGFLELDAHPDVRPAIETLKDAGVRVAAFTNGSSGVTETLFERAGLAGFVERVVSIDEIRVWKPRREVYLHCAETLRTPPGSLALVAAHPWDIHGAAMAGLSTGYVARNGAPFPSVMSAPDVTGASLVEVAEGLLRGKRGR